MRDAGFDVIFRDCPAKDRMGGHHTYSMCKEKRDVYKVLVRKPEGKRPLRRPKHRWEDNTAMDLK
jgi:hypothetical protein